MTFSLWGFLVLGKENSTDNPVHFASTRNELGAKFCVWLQKFMLAYMHFFFLFLPILIIFHFCDVCALYFKVPQNPSVSLKERNVSKDHKIIS